LIGKKELPEMISGKMIGTELAPMIGRILFGFNGLQILPGYPSFSKVSESLYILEISQVLRSFENLR
jgi:hypothetical protein